MPKDFRETWDSEQWVLDRLIESVEAGDAPFRDRLAKHLIEKYSNHDWHRRRVIDTGVILPNTQLDPRVANREDVVTALEDTKISNARLKKLSEGALLNNAEVAIWRRYVRERAFDPEFVFERGEGNFCVVVELKHSDRRRAHLAITNWDGQSGVLVAPHSTYTEALAALKMVGAVSMEDSIEEARQVFPAEFAWPHLKRGRLRLG